MVEGNGAPAWQQSWNSDAGRVRDSGGHFTSFDKERDAAIEEHLERGHNLGGEVVEGRPPAANDEQKSGFEITDPSDTTKLTELDVMLSQLGAKQGERATFTTKAEDFSYTVTVEPSGIIEITLSGQRALASSIRFSKDVSTAAQQWRVVSNYDTETGAKILPDSNQVRYLLSLLDPTRLEAASQTVDQTIVHAETQAEPPAKVENPLAGIPKSPEERYSRLLKILKNSGKPVWNALAARLNVVATYKGEFITALTDGAGEPEELRTAIEVGLKTAFDQLLTNEVLSQELQKALDGKYHEPYKILKDSERSQLITEIITSFLDTEWKPPARQGFLSRMRGWFASKVKPALSELLISDADVESVAVPQQTEPEVLPAQEVIKAEDNKAILDRIQANEIKLEQAKIATDSSAILRLNREIATDKVKLAEAQKQPTVETSDPVEQKATPWWERWFPSKGPKASTEISQQAADAEPVATQDRQAEIAAKLKAEHDAREKEKELANLDLEYVDNIIEGLIASGKARGNRDVSTLILALAQHEIDTDGAMTLNDSSEKRLKQLVEKAKIHPNALHAQERKFDHELQASTEAAVERSMLSPAKKDMLKKIVGRTAVVTTAFLLAFALGGDQGGVAQLDLGGSVEQLQVLVEAFQGGAIPDTEILQQTLNGSTELFRSWEEVIKLFGDPAAVAAPVTPELTNQVVASAAETAKGFINRLVQDPRQAEAALEQLQNYFTPERVQAIAKVVQEFDINAGPQMLTVPETQALAANSREAVQQITDLVDSIATPEQRASAATWINKVTAVLKDFSVIPPAR